MMARAAPGCCFGPERWGHVIEAGLWRAEPAGPPAMPGGYASQARWITDDYGDLWLVWDTLQHLDATGKPWGHHGRQ